jgi:hypothetical protein
MQTSAAASHLGDCMAGHAHTGVRGFGQGWMGVWILQASMRARPALTHIIWSKDYHSATLAENASLQVRYHQSSELHQ